MKPRLWSRCCRNPLSLLLPLHLRCPPQRILSGWPSKAACKNRGEEVLSFLYLLAPSPGLKGLHVLSERPVEEEAMVETTGSPCAFFSGLNVTHLINFLMTTVGFQGCNWQPASSSCCATVSAGQMFLDIMIPDHVFSECSWAVCWMVAQCASRFSWNKGEKWGASVMSTEKCMNGQILSMRKKKKTQAFGLNQRVSIGSSPMEAVPYLLWPHSSGCRAKTFDPNKVSVKLCPSLTPSAAPAIWVALSESQQRGAGRKQGSTFAVSLQSLVMNLWVKEERKIHPHEGYGNLFFLSPALRKEDLCPRGKAETK